MNQLFLSQVSIINKDKIDYSDYPFCIPSIKNLDSLHFTKPVTFFVGENAVGKSTLLEAIAVMYGFNAEGGSKNFSFSTNETHSSLHNFLRLTKGVFRAKDGYFLRAESFYNVASYIEDLDKIPSGSPKIISSYGGKSLHHQSHGESFMSLLINRFGGNGLYILDEPEAALSPSRQLGLLARLHDLVKQNSQFIIATHSPIVLAYPNADIYVLSNSGLSLTPYEQTEHYQVAKRFLNNPQTVLRHLLDN